MVAVAALGAGDDILLLREGGGLDAAHTPQAIDAVGRGLARGTVSAARLNDAVAHMLHLKARLGLLPRYVPGR